MKYHLICFSFLFVCACTDYQDDWVQMYGAAFANESELQPTSNADSYIKPSFGEEHGTSSSTGHVNYFSSSSQTDDPGHYDAKSSSSISDSYFNEELLAAGKYGEFLDSRDGQVYKTIEIGSLVWMAENLNYSVAGSFCYKNNTSYCAKYGRLYTWNVAIDICPNGWRLPTMYEFESLLTGNGTNLKATSSWSSGGCVKCNGTNSTGFSALPAGSRSSDGVFDFEGSCTYLWSSTKGNAYYNYELTLCGGMANVESYEKEGALSVRCVKDEIEKMSSSSTALQSSSSTPKRMVAAYIEDFFCTESELSDEQLDSLNNAIEKNELKNTVIMDKCPSGGELCDFGEATITMYLYPNSVMSCEGLMQSFLEI